MKLSYLALGLAMALANPFIISNAAAQAVDASSAQKRVYVGKLKGAKPSTARDLILKGLEEDSRFSVVETEETLTTGASQQDIAAFAAANDVDVVILGNCRFSKGWSATLDVYNGGDGSKVESVDVPGGNFENYQEQLTGGATYFPVVERTPGLAREPAQEAEVPEPVVEEEVAVEPVLVVDNSDARPSPLQVSVGVRMYSRAFHYTDNIGRVGDDAPLDQFDLPAAPMPTLAARWYPGAHYTNNALAHIGVEASYERGVGTRVSRIDDSGRVETFGQTHQLFYAGLRGRIPVSLFTFGVFARYGGHTFGLRDIGTGSPDALFPNVNYGFVEGGADGEVRVNGVILGAYGGYLAVLSSGDVSSADWFPSTKVQGVHFGGHVGFELSRYFDLLGGLDARMYGLNFNPIPVDTTGPVAGGATDRYVSASLILRINWPEKTAAQAAPSGESTDGGSGGGDSMDSFDDFD